MGTVAKLMTFFVFMFIGIGILGGISQGGGGIAATKLTAAVTATDDSIPVVSTNGFTSTGVIVIGDERIAYSDTDATHFKDTMLSPMIRGANNTEAVAHSSDAGVRTVEAGMINQAMAYSIATVADASGLWVAVAIPLALFKMVGMFFQVNLSFLGTDMAFLTYVWAAFGIGAIVAFGLALAGARRV